MFGSRMMEPGSARAAGCRSTSTSATGSSPASRTASLGTDAHRVALRLPRLLASPRWRDPVRGEHRRLRLRHPDHPPAPRRREADRRGPDPDLLRRRDLLRQRHGVRPGRRPGRRRLPPSARWASAPGSWVPRPHEYGLKAERRQLARDDPASCSTSLPPGEVLDLGCSGGLLGRADPRDWATTSSASTARGAPASATGVDDFVQADLEQGLPPRSATASTSSSPPTSSSTSASPTAAPRRWPRRLGPGGRLDRVDVPNFGHWYPRARVAHGHVRLRPRGILDETHLRFFTRRGLLRTFAAARLNVESLDYTGVPARRLPRGDRSARRGMSRPTASSST